MVGIPRPDSGWQVGGLAVVLQPMRGLGVGNSWGSGVRSPLAPARGDLRVVVDGGADGDEWRVGEAVQKIERIR